MVDNSLSTDNTEVMQRLWKSLAHAFPYQHATASEADLSAQVINLDVTEGELAEAIEWLRNQQMVEVAEEAGRWRLTPQGRRHWREVMDIP